jgi:hypothetical protein
MVHFFNSLTARRRIKGIRNQKHKKVEKSRYRKMDPRFNFGLHSKENEENL